MYDQDKSPTESDRDRDIRLSADVLGQLDDSQRRSLEVDLQTNADLRRQHEDLSRIANALSRRQAAESLPAPSLELRDAVQTRLNANVKVRLPDEPAKQAGEYAGWSRRRVVAALAVAACLLLLLAVPIGQSWRTRQQTNSPVAVISKPVIKPEVPERNGLEINNAVARVEYDRARANINITGEGERSKARGQGVAAGGILPANAYSQQPDPNAVVTIPAKAMGTGGQPVGGQPVTQSQALGGYSGSSGGSAITAGGNAGQATAGLGGMPGAGLQGAGAGAGWSAYPGAQGPGMGSPAGMTGGSVAGAPSNQPPRFAYGAGRPSQADRVNRQSRLSSDFVVPVDDSGSKGFGIGESQVPLSQSRRQELTFERARLDDWRSTGSQPPASRERYEAIVENPFVPVSRQPLSTFSIDVDTASYANVRRFLSQNQLPPANAVRIEELINYFSYNDPAPVDDQPFASRLEVTECPWQPRHRLVRVALRGKTIARQQRPGCNLVFLLDVSGSMKDANKLPLLKEAMKLLVGQLDENDRVAIVTYASQAGVRLKSTVADQHNVIRDAINGLNANGSTNGGAGIQLAYEQALAGAIEGGVNRVILATDGDLNVGITDDDALVRLIKEKAASDVFLTVLGFGEGNLQDAKLEKLADNGNGLYAYIDNQSEARKVLVEQIEGSLVTIAKDVKIKIEFNPAEVQAYRLIGYENRLLTAAEFDDDKKDAGEIGAGHCVTALYEIVPAAPPQLAVAPLKYQQPAAPVVPQEQLSDAAKTGELLTLSLRYKLPDADESTLVEVPLLNSRKRFSEASMDFRFATAVASFGMLLRDSVHRGDTSFAAVEEIAAAAIGDDENGYRTEFLDLVRRAATLK